MGKLSLKIGLLCLILIPVELSGQRSETGIYFTNDTNRLVLEVENDLLFQSDGYYTAGIAISYTNKRLKNTPSQIILSLISKNDVDFTGFGIQQRIFTPYSIEDTNYNENDRPYSAYLLLTNYSVYVNKSRRMIITNEIGIGAMGPMAGGEQVQTFIHKLLGNTLPAGWDNQLNNAALIDYNFHIEKSFFRGFVAEHFIPYAEARIGTLTDRVKFGLKIRFGNKNHSMMALTEGKRFEKKFIWEWLFAANLQGVFYDATLQGGVMNKDESISLPRQDVIERQYQMRMGINFYIKRFSFRYMVIYNSCDFVNAVVHRYGSVNFGYSF